MIDKHDKVILDVEIECGMDTRLLNDMEWFVLSGETPRKDKGLRRNARTKPWRILDICTWIGRKVNYIIKNTFVCFFFMKYNIIHQ